MTIQPVLVNLDTLYASGEEPEAQLVARLSNEVAAFGCRRSPYHESFLKDRAAEHSRRNTSKTYLVLDGEALERFVNGEEVGSPLLAANFTVAVSSVNPSNAQGASGKSRKRLGEHMFKRDGALGCFVIGELCRSDAFGADQVPGSHILEECLGVIRDVQGRIGGRVVLVDSRQSVLDSLYAPAGFRQLDMTELDTEDGVPLVTSFAVL